MERCSSLCNAHVALPYRECEYPHEYPLRKLHLGLVKCSSPLNKKIPKQSKFLTIILNPLEVFCSIRQHFLQQKPSKKIKNIRKHQPLKPIKPNPQPPVPPIPPPGPTKAHLHKAGGRVLCKAPAEVAGSAQGPQGAAVVGAVLVEDLGLASVGSRGFGKRIQQNMDIKK